MKKIQIILIAMSFMFIAASCERVNSIVSTDGTDHLEITYSGDVRFSNDEKSIQSITPKGYLKFRKNDKKLLAKSNFHGEVSYEMYLNGERMDPSGNNARRLIAEAIKEMIAYGFDAKGRLSRLYESGGSEAVLNKTAEIKNDQVKSMYLEFLLLTDTLSSDELLQTAKQICSVVGSDFERAKLLKKFPAAFLKDSLTTTAWLDAVGCMGSDFEKANAFKSILDQPLNDVQFDQVLDATKIIHADFEKVNLLKQLIDKRTSGEENFDKMLAAIDRIGSSMDKLNLLKKLVQTGMPEGELFDKLLGAVNHLAGDMDKTSMLTFLTNKDIRSEQQWISLINATANINSDLEKTNLLVRIARKMPPAENVKASYMNTAKTIHSDMDYRRVVKEVDN